MRNILITAFLLIFSYQGFTQEVEKVYLNKNDSVANLYHLFQPVKPEKNAFLVLLPGFGQTPEDVLLQTELPVLAAENGILTIIPVVSTGLTSFGIDKASQKSLHTILKDVKGRFNLEQAQFFIGGFSIGGSAAFRFAQSAQSNFEPAAVFGIDPPLDFERLYHSFQRHIRLSVNTEPSGEAIYMIERMEKEMKGSPETALINYRKMSPYSFSDTTQAALQALRNIPLRIYTEPDINWWLENRNSDYSAMNALDASAMVNELNLLGNEEAQFITTENKGYRKPYDNKHPHSWSIVNNQELIDWLLKHL